MDSRNTFISTVDHLPSDIIRSLWLIQTCNIESENLQNKLDAELARLREGKQPDAQALVCIRRNLRKYASEAVSEAQYLHNQLVTHHDELSDQISQLQGGFTRDPNQEKALREQLIQHYKENPLASQREAEREKERKEKSGLKLVLKMKKKKKEEVYCFCRQGAFGSMIACDNRRCKNGEWFHYKCVGLARSEKVVGRWYCSGECRSTNRAR